MKTPSNEKEPELKDRVSSLFELMKTEKIEELELKDAASYIYLKRKGRAPKHQVVNAIAPVAPAVQENAQESTEKAVAGETVKSPITGIFYRAPSPASPSFVKEGDVVAAEKPCA